jgi:GT2 family glycosyltransferase
MDLSIIIVNWNRKEYLKRCIASIKAYTEGLKYEVVVVDNNSTDGSREWLRKAHPDVKLIENETNYGFSKANNIGLKYSLGKYVLFLNNDTYIRENAFKKMYDLVSKREEACILGPSLVYENGTGQVSAGRFPRLYLLVLDRIFGLSKIMKLFLGYKGSIIYGFENINNQSGSSYESVDWVSGACMMAEKKFVNQVGGMDDSYSFGLEDVDLSYQAKDNGREVLHIKTVEVVHHKGASRNHDSKKNDKHKKYDKMKRIKKAMFEGKIRFFEKNEKEYEANIVYVVLLVGMTLRSLAYFLKGCMGGSSDDRMMSKVYISIAKMKTKQLVN